MSKTSDVAAALALLRMQAPTRSRSNVYAVDADQAALFADSIAGFVARARGCRVPWSLGPAPSR